MREDWKGRVSWNDGVFDSLERFVDSKPTENQQAFASSGDIDDLYQGFSKPSPEPSAKHVEYMVEYVRSK